MKLYFHILRAHVGPFVFSFVTLMFIFVLQFLMKAVDQLVGKGLSPWVIAELIALSLSWMVVLAVPMSVLVASLMVFGKLSSQNEITAMKASGMSLYKMMLPVVLCSVILTYFLIQFNNKVLPEANHRFKALMIDIRRKKPTLSITRGVFSQDLQGYSILARKTYEYSNDLEGVTIYDYTDATTNVVITAEQGKVSFTPDYRKLIMDLQNGEIHQLGTTDMESYRRMRFVRHRIVMDAVGFDFERSDENAFSRGDRELSAQEMQAYVDSLEHVNETARQQTFHLSQDQGTPRLPHFPFMTPPQATDPIRQQALILAMNDARAIVNMVENQLLIISYNQNQINQFLVEINKKYSIPFACIVFVFIGAPLGVIARKGTFGVAASLSLGFFVLYWASLIGGEKLGDRALLAPWVGMWSANIILSIVGLYLTLKMGRDTLMINWEFLRKYIPAFLRPPEQLQDTGDQTT